MAGRLESNVKKTKFTPVPLSKTFNRKARKRADALARVIAERMEKYPLGRVTSWGIPFELGESAHRARLIVLDRDAAPVRIPVQGAATHVCFLHEWVETEAEIRRDCPEEGRTIGRYRFVYADGQEEVIPLRARFEVSLQEEGRGDAWLALPWKMYAPFDGRSAGPYTWGYNQPGVQSPAGTLLCYAAPNPRPNIPLRAIMIEATTAAPLVVAGITLYRGTDHPLRHLPRRYYRLRDRGRKPRVKALSIDQGVVGIVNDNATPRDKAWRKSPHLGINGPEPARADEHLLQLVGARDATVTVELENRKAPVALSLGSAFDTGQSVSGGVSLEVVGRKTQWMNVRVLDGSTGRPTPVRLQLSGPHGNYIAPYGHHELINTNWFEDYGADLSVGDRPYAYVNGEFTTELPVGEIGVEMFKGFEYEPVRTRVRVRPGQRRLDLRINRWTDLRRKGWVTADTHVHFITPQTAWLEAQAEGINVVNLLASQWGGCSPMSATTPAAWARSRTTPSYTWEPRTATTCSATSPCSAPAVSRSTPCARAGRARPGWAIRK